MGKQAGINSNFLPSHQAAVTKVLSDCSKTMRKEPLKNFFHFVTLCCGILPNNSSSNPTTTFSTTASVCLTTPEIFLPIHVTFLLLLDSVFRVFVLNVRGFLLISARFLDFPVLIPFQDAGGVFQSFGR